MQSCLVKLWFLLLAFGTGFSSLDVRLAPSAACARILSEMVVSRRCATASGGPLHSHGRAIACVGRRPQGAGSRSDGEDGLRQEAGREGCHPTSSPSQGPRHGRVTCTGRADSSGQHVLRPGCGAVEMAQAIASYHNFQASNPTGLPATALRCPRSHPQPRRLGDDPSTPATLATGTFSPPSRLTPTPTPTQEGRRRRQTQEADADAIAAAVAAAAIATAHRNRNRHHNPGHC